jgi:ATP-dependent DNA helicase RecG
MRSFRKNNELQSKIGEDWSSLNFIEKAAISYAYEKGSVRTKELSNIIDDYSINSVRNALKHLTKIGIFERVATSPTSPNQYYKLIK